VYDTTLSDSFKKVKKWATELKAFNPNTIIVIAGNKADMRKFDIDRETVSKYAEEINAKHFYTSAKSGEGLSEMFNSITTDLSNSLKSKPGSKKLSVKIENDTNKQQKKGCC
jgi:GTPase SAR1 family protein